MTHSIRTQVLVSNSSSVVPQPFVKCVDVKVSSAGAPWSDALDVEFDLVQPAEFGKSCIQRTTITQPLIRNAVVERLITGNAYEAGTTHLGVVHLDPAGSETGVRWKDAMHVLFMMPTDKTFQRVVEDSRSALPAFGLERRNHVEDMQVWKIGLSILEECMQGFPSGRIYGESLAMALASRVITVYSCKRRELPKSESGLPSNRLRKVIELIEENLDKDLSLSDLASAAWFSEFHFSRMFKLSTGATPHRYVMERRVAKAKELLEDRDISIKEISARLGFGDQAHFTTVFKNLSGTTPKKFREQIA